MGTIDELRTGILREAANANGEQVHRKIGELSQKYGVQQQYVRETLVEMSRQALITLTASDGRKAVAFDDWPGTQEEFFLPRADGNYIQFQLRATGKELLDGIAKRKIGLEG